MDCDAEDAREAECLALASNWRGPQPSSLGASSRSHLDTPFGTPGRCGIAVKPTSAVAGRARVRPT